MSALPGFYGKLPVVGDFVQRRLPAEFVARWDRWVQESTLAARAALGIEWTSYYLAAQPWRFVLAPGCIDNQGWIGLVTPSVDRVGRYFPLTVAQPLPARIAPLAVLTGAGDWFCALEQLVQQAVHHGLDPDSFDAALARLGGAPLPPDDAAGEDATMPLPQAGRRAPLAWRLDHGNDYIQLAGVVAALLRPVCLFAGADPPTVLALELLPPPALAVALLDGQWEAHGWRYDDKDASHRYGALRAERAARAAQAAQGDGAALDLTRPLSPKST